MKEKADASAFSKPPGPRAAQNANTPTAIYKPAGRGRQGEKRSASSLLLLLYYTIQGRHVNKKGVFCGIFFCVLFFCV
jgi:hypothetical protein